MARALRIEYPGAFYHITARGIERRRIFNFDSDKEKFLYFIKEAHQRFNIIVHAYCLMSNHYHLMISTPDANLDKFMWSFNKCLTDRLRVHSKRINRILGGPYSWSLIDDQAYRYNVVRYVFQNPVRAGIVRMVESYPFSTLFYEKKDRKFCLEVIPVLDEGNLHYLNWFNLLPKGREILIQSPVYKTRPDNPCIFFAFLIRCS